MNFNKIPQFPHAGWESFYDWESLEHALERWKTAELCPLDVSPDYQRAHVWTPEQQTAYVEYALMGGEVGRTIIFNCPGWQGTYEGPFELVDGKQRIEAVLSFLRGETRAFGLLRSEFEGRLPNHVGFLFRICKVATRAEILRLYLNINAGGTPHSREELERVRLLLREAENGKV
jgi:hypothetical protein